MMDFADQLAAASPERLRLIATRLKAALDARERRDQEPIAITGMSCRFPKARNVDEFWTLLERGGDAIVEVPPDRFDVNQYYDPDPDARGKMYVRDGGFIDRPFDFDPGFFGISPREALSMDPQQRLLLEVSWEAFEDAGEATAALNGRDVGVFVGHSTNDYVRRSFQSEIDVYSGTGSATSIAAGRISYVFGLTGPNLAIDTACSSSLVALHLACRSLRDRECEAALAAGVNLILAPEPTIYFCKLRALSPDGRCKAFDALANGYVRGEGCGALVLKRLSDARATGDRIHAIIRGSAINQDGRSAGLTVPNRFAQEALLRQALVASGVSPHEVDYLEAHGTGTPLGDPIEVQAIGAVHQGRADPLFLGSVKTNLGHLEAAAGIAGVIKTILALQQARIPQHLHFNRPNPYIPWQGLPISIPTGLVQWPDRGTKRRIAGVSSFGFSGTNVHVVLEEAPAIELAVARFDRPLHVLCLSAKSEQALPVLARSMADRVGNASSGSVADVCFSANSGRSHFSERLTLVAASEREASEALIEFANGASGGRVRTSSVRNSANANVCFLFTGQGAQYVQMGRELYESLPVFRRTLDECDELLRHDLDLPLLTVLYPDTGARSPIDETAYAQPALFALEYSLGAVWRQWGVEPAFCIGHSIGELVAACVAGVFSLSDGLKLAAERGRLMQALPRNGIMASVQADGQVVSRIVDELHAGVSIAAVNGPASTVISGETGAVDAVLEHLSRRGLGYRRLTVSHAFHSALMDPMLEPFEKRAAAIDYEPPQIGLVSTVTGQLAAPEDFISAAYWRRQARQPVRFADAIRTLDERGCTVYLEVGPQPVLTALARSCVADRHQLWAPSLRKAVADWQQMLQTLGDLYLRGVAVDWRGFDDGYPRRRVSVPTYPYQRTPYALTGDSALRPTELSRAVPLTIAPETNRPEDFAYDVQWTLSPARNAVSEPVCGRWLLLVDRAGVGDSLATRLNAEGNDCVLVQPGEAFRALGGNRWQVRPDSPDDFTQLIAAAEEARPYVGIVHAWSLNIPVGDSLDEASLRAGAVLGTASTLHLTQAISLRHPTQPPPLWVVTCGVHAIRPDDTAQGVAQSPVWGLARAVAIEYPNLRCTRVDLGHALDAERTAENAAAALLRVLRSPQGEDQIALRDGECYVPRMRRAVLNDQPAVDIRTAATYLISGGLGSLGLLVANWLVAKGARHLVLVGRREPSEPAQRAIARLQQSGVTVMTVAGDVGASDQVQQLFSRIAATMPPLKGIVHAAGVLDDGALSQQQWSRFESVMRPKLLGGWNLHAQSLGLDLDFLVLFSSIASMLGAPTQANYAAANAFLDALAHYRGAKRQPAIAVNWGPWADAGMAARQQPAVLRTWELLGIGMLSSDDALAAFGRLLGSPVAQVGVLKADWSKLFSMFPPGLEPPIFRDLVKGRRRTRPASGEWVAVTKRIERATTEDATRAVRAFIESQVAEVLGRSGTDRIDPDTGFFDLGMDSMMAVELTTRLRANLGDAHVLPVSFLFNHPTIQRVADYLVREVLAARTGDAQTPRAPAPRSTDGAVAIIGYACTFPGAPTEEAFWELLCEGKDAIVRVPADRWDIDAYYDPDPKAPGKMVVRDGGFLENIDRFDAQFFGISPREATKMDPQHRLLLETTWRALENAHQRVDRLKGTKTAVYVGISGNDYIRAIGPEVDPAEVDAFLASGNLLSIAAGRLSHVFGFEGPCLSIDTACSSSLVAVHLACDSLRTGKAPLAVAGGVNIILAPEINVSLSKIGALAPDGRCKTFDAAANGYVRSEGCGIVVLKRLEDARADGDEILAVIRSSAINHDGRSSGLTVPNGASQVALFRDALEDSGLRADEIHYVEAHGTGTPLGDPIEMQSIASVYGDGRPFDRPLLVGSVKTNIGHLEAAAGVAGLVKVVACMQRGRIPPHLHLRQPNPYIDWQRIPIRIPTSVEAWPAGEHPTAAVSSFGFSGTNAHCIVEAPPDPPPIVSTDTPARPAHLLLLSAKTEPALREHAANLADRLEGLDDRELANAFFSVNAGRVHFPRRAFVAARTVADATVQLRQLAQGPTDGSSMLSSDSPASPRIAFLFTGQGSQYVDMGRRLFDTQPLFRRVVEEAAAALDGVLDEPLQSVLYPCAGTSSRIDDDLYAQTSLFVLEYALVRLWESWGVRPSMIVGHSIGECAAACAAGVFTLETGVRLVAERARLLRGLPRDQGMFAIAAAAGAVQDVVDSYANFVSVAAYNSPRETVVSGSVGPLVELCKALEQRGIRSQQLNVPHAFHSAQMAGVADDLLRVARQFDYREPAVPVISTVTGDFVTDGTMSTPEYWARQLLVPVKFMESIRALASAECRIVLEIGPHPTLSILARQTLEDAASETTWLSSLRRGSDDWQEMLKTAGQLYLRGVDLDCRGFDRDYARSWVRVPSYPFQRQRFWPSSPTKGPVSLKAPRRPPASAAPDAPLLGRRLYSPSLQDVVFENRFSAEQPAFLPDHRIYSIVVVPGASHLAMVAAAASRLGVGPRIELCDVTFPEGMIIGDGESRIIQLMLSPAQDDGHAFRIVSALDDGNPSWLTHSTGRLATESLAAGVPPLESRADIQQRCTDHVTNTKMFYRLLSEYGIELGPSFQWIDEIWRRPTEGLARLRAPVAGDHVDDFYVHPGWIDACFQLVTVTLTRKEMEFGTYLPISVGRFTLFARPDSTPWIHVTLRPKDDADPTGFESDIMMATEDGRPIAAIERFRVRLAPRESLSRFAQRKITDSLYALQWTKAALGPATRSVAMDGTWIVLERNDQRRAMLAGSIDAAGGRCLGVAPGAAFEKCGDDRYRVDPADVDQFRALLADAWLSGTVKGVVHVWGGVDSAWEPRSGDSAVLKEQEYGCLAALNMVKAIVSMRLPNPPKLVIVTAGAQPVSDRYEAIDVTHSTLWGLARVVALEHPHLRCARIDLDPRTSLRQQADALFAELQRESDEDQIAYCGADRHVARLSRYRVASSGSDGELALPPVAPYRIVRSEHGSLNDLAVEIVSAQAPGPGEVEIRVAAAGLNFRDVLQALGLYPGSSGALGWEASGIVTAVGADVSHLEKGDAVVALAPGSFARSVTTDARLAVIKPDNVTFTSAAGVPVVFLTAHYALRQLARLHAGEKVFVHAAAGGVGLAAVQLARRIGAEVFATAGSEEKREYLRTLGIRHVFDSRSFEFEQAVRDATGGSGVDVVLNSLAGDYIPRSLSLLADGGRFVEIGKIGTWTEAQVKSVRPDVHYFVFALDELVLEDPRDVGASLSAIMSELASGELELMPHTSFATRKAKAAFRYMAQAKHIGKVILEHPAGSDRETGAMLRHDATYLITGAYGGLGIGLTQWLIAQGARHLVLFGRRPPGSNAAEILGGLELAGAQILRCQGDVSAEDDVRRVVEQIGREMPPLRGVFHAAGVLDDGILLNQAWDRFLNVMSPKVRGTINLHNATQDAELDCFVLFSSSASLFGFPGQGNYAAANSFLDSFAHYRRTKGQPALSINWGPWEEVGMTVGLKRSWSGLGISTIKSEQGFETLGLLLREKSAQVAVLPIDWSQIAFPNGRTPPMLSHLVGEFRATLQPSPEWIELKERVAAAPPAERKALVVGRLNDMGCAVLGLKSTQLLPSTLPLNELGFDSLIAVEFANRLGHSAGIPVSVTLLFDYPTLDALAGHLLADVLDLSPPQQGHIAGQRKRSDPNESGGALIDSLASLSDDEVTRLNRGPTCEA